MKKIKKMLLAVLSAALTIGLAFSVVSCGADDKKPSFSGGTSTGSSDTGSSYTGSSSGSSAQTDPFLLLENFVIKEDLNKDAYQKKIESKIEGEGETAQYVLKIEFYHKGLTYKYTLNAPVQTQAFTSLTMTITQFERLSNQSADCGDMDDIKGKTQATITFDWTTNTADCSNVYVPILYLGPFK